METLKAPEGGPQQGGQEASPMAEPGPRHRDTDPAPAMFDSEPPWGSGPDVIVDEDDGDWT